MAEPSLGGQRPGGQWRSPRLTKRRLFGLDRSGPPPPQTTGRRAAAPVDDPQRDRLRPPSADPRVPRHLALQPRWTRRARRHHVRAHRLGRLRRRLRRSSHQAVQPPRRAAWTPSPTALLIVSGWWSSTGTSQLLPRWALGPSWPRASSRCSPSARYGLKRGVELKINWPGRLGVAPVMGSLFFAMAGRTSPSARCCCTSGSAWRSWRARCTSSPAARRTEVASRGSSSA